MVVTLGFAIVYYMPFAIASLLMGLSGGGKPQVLACGEGVQGQYSTMEVVMIEKGSPGRVEIVARRLDHEATRALVRRWTCRPYRNIDLHGLHESETMWRSVGAKPCSRAQANSLSARA